MEEKDKKVIIIGAVVVIIIAVIAVVMMRQPAEAPDEAPVEAPAEEPVVEKPVFEPDETIPAEFCRKVITRAQLREITGYEKDRFVFEEEKKVDEIFGFMKNCIIKIEEKEEEKEIIISFPLLLSYDEFYKKMTKEMAEKIAWGVIPEGIREIQDVGERAFSFSMLGEAIPGVPATHLIGFLEPDTKQIIAIIVRRLNYEVALSLAKQVEANVITKPVVEDPVAEEPAKKTPFEIADETIPAEFCRQLITRVQLKEITGYEKDRFVFRDRKEEEDPVLGRAKMCEIRIYEYGMEKIVIGVLLDNTYEEFYEFMKEKAELIKEKAEGLIPERIIPERIRIGKIQDVGERAFSFTVIHPEIHMIGLHMIGFVDADTNQVMLVTTEEFSYEVALSLAKQVEANLR